MTLQEIQRNKHNKQLQFYTSLYILTLQLYFIALFVIYMVVKFCSIHF